MNHFVKILFVMMALGLFSPDAVGQSSKPDLSNKPLKEIKGMAKNALRLGDTYTALFYYLEWADRKPDNHSLAYQVADLYRVTRDYGNAEIWYEKIAKEQAGKYPLSTYYLAQMQMSQGDYDEAKINFKKFKKNGAKTMKDPKYKKLTRTSMMGCDFAIGLKDSAATAVAENLGSEINKAHIEFSPMLWDENTLVYGSLREDSINYYDVKDHDSLNIPLRKLYYAEKSNGDWVDKGEFEGPFNQDDAHVGNGVFSEDGNRMYFTKCKKNWKGKVICQLYYADRNDSGWQTPVKMNDVINMPNYTTTQPAIGRESKRNREIIYFVSDRPGGKGGYDIWYTEYRKKKNIYKTPKNAGSKINTPGSEFTPYYDMATHKMYFSSDGKVGLGGLDVFVAEGEKSRFQPAQNMQNTINSPADDLDFTIAGDHKGGFLVSNRSGGMVLLNENCCDDIYEFTFTEYIDIALKTKVTFNGDDLDSYTVKLYIQNEDDLADINTDISRFLSKEYTKVDKDFVISLEQGYDYVVEVTKDGFLNSSEDVSTKHISESKELNVNMVLNRIPKKATVLRGILYEFNSAKLTPAAKNTIDTTLFKMLTANPEIIVEISSHTDNKGTESYNQKLSERRAKSVVNYLSAKGIRSKRMEYAGYGESQPIASNENTDGTDNPEGRKLNRRTEFRILGKIDLDDIDEDEEDNVEDKKPKKYKKKDLKF